MQSVGNKIFAAGLEIACLNVVVETVVGSVVDWVVTVGAAAAEAQDATKRRKTQ